MKSLRAPGVTPRVSVCFITYNHETYVAQAIESVVAQRTTFDYEIVVGEDCSTDGTRRIVEAYAERYPGRIRLNLQTENRGLLRNFLTTFESCRGEYVALLDGDDFWTSSRKLQKQVDFLDEYPDCSICFHDVEVLLPDGSVCEVNYTRPDHPPFATIEDLFETNFIATCSAMLRKCALPGLPPWYASSPLEDWPLYILYAERGKIGYLKEPMGVYRSHGRGLWSALDPVAQISKVIEFLRMIDERLAYRYTDRISASVARYSDLLSRAREAKPVTVTSS